MSYHHLTKEERKKLEEMNQGHSSVRRIAKALNRSPSTISRELCRNAEEGKYKGVAATRKYTERRTRCKPKGKLGNKELTSYIREKLGLTWSPEQISGRLPIDFSDAAKMRIAHSTIYRWLHRGLFSQSAELKLNLRHHGRRHGETRGKFNGVRELRERSRQVLRRKRLGDWEVDTIVSSRSEHQECLLSVCDRKSRYCGLVLLKRRSAVEVMRGFQFLFDNGDLPLKTMTSDRGTEFACYKDVETLWSVPFYFTRPHSPWQKPSVENQNGLIRQFFPRGTNFNEISREQVAFVMNTLNNRPKKCLGFLTPVEVLHLA